MTPLLLFLLGCVATYIGIVTAAFSALMRLSLRIMAEGSGRGERLQAYLEDPGRLFIPARLLLGVVVVLATALLARVTGVDQAGFPVLIVSMVGFIVLCEHVIPLVIVRHDPERVLELLLPSFDAITRVLLPITGALRRVATSRRRERPQAAGDNGQVGEQAPEPNAAAAGEPETLQEGQARAMLRTLVDFRETMVREVMTPRPDIVAVNAEASVEELRTLFREQQVLAGPGISGLARQRPGIRLRQGPDPAAGRVRSAGPDYPSHPARNLRARDQASGGIVARVPAQPPSGGGRGGRGTVARPAW